MFGSIGPTELIIIGIVALLIFGQRLPDVMRSLGKGMLEFKKGLRSVEDEIRDIGLNSLDAEPQGSPDETQPSADSAVPDLPGEYEDGYEEYDDQDEALEAGEERTETSAGDKDGTRKEPMQPREHGAAVEGQTASGHGGIKTPPSGSPASPT